MGEVFAVRGQGVALPFDEGAVLARQAVRYGLTVGDVQAVITSAIGGETVTTTVIVHNPLSNHDANFSLVSTPLSHGPHTFSRLRSHSLGS